MYDNLPITCKNCEIGTPLISNMDWDDDNGCRGYTISCEDDEFICPECFAHHIICDDCEINSEPVLCQFIGHQGIICPKKGGSCNASHRILRPNKSAYDILLKISRTSENDEDDNEDLEDNYDDHLFVDTESFNANDSEEYARELDRIGYVDSTYPEPVPYCLEDLKQFYCTHKIQPNDNQSIPLAYACYDKKSREQEQSNRYALNGPDGGYHTIWKCCKCKKFKIVLDK